MGVRVVGFDGQQIQLTAPLSSNINDKGCAFGGSLSGVMTLSCWSLCAIQLELRGLRPDIYVQDSTVRYLAPLYEDLQVEARLLREFDWDTMAATLRERGRARAVLSARTLRHGDSDAAQLEGRFVAILPKPAAHSAD